jgi:hypothetical protein
MPADLVRVNHAVGTNHDVATQQYRDVIARVIERALWVLGTLHLAGYRALSNSAVKRPDPCRIGRAAQSTRWSLAVIQNQH